MGSPRERLIDATERLHGQAEDLEEFVADPVMPTLDDPLMQRPQGEFAKQHTQEILGKIKETVTEIEGIIK
jgi:hypothetical protein